VRDDHRFDLFSTEDGTLHLGFTGECGGNDNRGGNPSTFEPDRVVQTARRAGSSIAYGGDHNVVLGGNPIEECGGCDSRETFLRVLSDC
jgi:hypothetical protein